MSCWLWIATLCGLAARTVPAEAQVRYTVSVPDPSEPSYRVAAEFAAPGETLLVSLPAWTPGHYEIEDYARYVRSFEATDGDGHTLRWDKLDKDTWRIASRGASTVRVTMDVWADTVNLSMSLLKEDFGFFNGTNLFLFREGPLDVPAEVRFDLPEGWAVVTSLEQGSDVYRTADYHELVDAPTFVGRFALDSMTVDGATIVVAVYPRSRFRGQARERFLDGVRRIATVQHELFGGPPYDRYVLLLYLETEPISFGGGLEHAYSQLDILPAPAFADAAGNLGPFVLPLVSHELFHVWNVKRIRPAQLWPYDYRVEQFTPLLWVSEGITEYYASVTLARAGLRAAAALWGDVESSIASVQGEDRIEAVEDASLNAWINPLFVSSSYYYPKGALLGLLLDIRIRQATENRASLDDVMRRLYGDFYRKGKGFTTAEFLEIVSSYLGAEETRAFYESYIDGREPLPYAETFALAGVRYRRDTITEPFLGVAAVPEGDGPGLQVLRVVPGSAAQAAGLRAGDRLLKVGEVMVGDPLWGTRFRARYQDRLGAPLTVEYERGGESQTAQTTVRTRVRYQHRVIPLDEIPTKARRIRDGILKGKTRG